MTPEGFFEKFEQFADVPDAVGKMRELVRHLAVTGRLVPQDTRDEPAGSLLGQISAHKAALAITGQLRGMTSVAPCAQPEGAFPLPSTWVWARFGEIVVNRDGERIPVSKEERATKAKTYDYYGASGVIDKIDNYLFDKPLLLIGEDGANLINRSTPIAFMARGQYWVNNHAHVLDGISEDFLRYIELHINAINLEPYVTGSAQPKMNQAKMNSIPIALPPLAEQKRIVAKVDELMALCDQLEAQQQEREARHAVLARAALARFAAAPTPVNLQLLFHPSYAVSPADLRKSILTLAVQGRLVPQDPAEESGEDLRAKIEAEKRRLSAEGELKADKKVWLNASTNPPHDLPGSWCWVRLQDVFEISRGGSPRPAGDPRYFGGPIPWITVGEVTKDSGKFLTQTGTGLTEEGAERSRFINPGDLLLTNSGATLGVPKLSTIRGCMNDGVAVLRQFHSFDLNDFGYLYLTQQTAAFREVNQGMGQPNLNTPIIAGWFFPLPPLAEQRRIVAKVDELMALVDELETQLAAAKSTAANLLSAVVAELTSLRSEK